MISIHSHRPASARSNSPAPQPRSPSRDDSHDNLETMYPHNITYKDLPTSYEKRPGEKRGGRVMRTVRGKQKVALTPMERLPDRDARYQYVKQHGHAFGRLHGFHFNPYGMCQAAAHRYGLISRPPNVQVGWGDFALHEIIGLKDDYSTFNEIRGIIRKALVTYQPKNLTSKNGKGLKWTQYGSSARQNIQDYVHKKYPFLQHFRNESEEDSWFIKFIAQQYLARSRAYNNPKARKRYLRRHASGSKRDEEEEEEEDPDLSAPGSEDADEGYDDYEENAPAPNSGTGSSRNRSGRQQNNPPQRPQSKLAVASRAPAAPAPTSNRDNCRADKIVEKERAREKATGSGASKAAAASSKAAAASSKGKGKAQRKPVHKEGSEEEEEEDEEPVRKVTKPVGKSARNQRVVESSRENSPAPAPTPPPALTKASKRKAADNPKEPEPPAQEPQEPPRPPPPKSPGPSPRNSAAGPSNTGSSGTAASSSAPAPAPGALGSPHVIAARKMLLPVHPRQGLRVNPKQTTK